MNPADLIGTTVGVGMIVAGLVLVGYCLWWRSGRSSSARWWMRTEPVEQMQGYPPFEALGLVWLPVAAETLMFIGALVTLGPWLADNLDLVLYPLVVLNGAQFLLLIGARVVSYNTVLPLWIYPRWLRRERATDARWLRRQSRQSRQRPESRQHPQSQSGGPTG
ncbi:hypothetical protein [Corynebacterium suedekumii]|uniref:Uncharacterized protein n=1 Tax=Corynebacterium suedekumii TaxID=3049801 RepID=A0ABY8VIL9_9CORY|nr:hypothetical protein [Corynebacterium suedekumii]WIM69358.1 hypothetical protein QP029_08765 [Corynebacterium suedekumii]